jgi:hypothetical protein
VDSNGNAYVCGAADSTQTTFPIKTGPDLTYNGNADAFVSKVKADGTELVYCGYIGGEDLDHGYGIAVDRLGNAYVCGWTSSTEATFPVITGPNLTYNGGTYDAFVVKVKADGTGLDYCGYIGGEGSDQGYGIAVDQSGNTFVCGEAGPTFPVKIGPDLTYNGNADAFISKVKADGTELVYCGYIGGGGWDDGYGIAIDQTGSAYVCGYTTSTEATFPVKSGPDLTYNGIADAYVAKIKADGTGLHYCGYIGGDSADFAYGIAVDRLGNAYVCGYTRSSEISFPVKSGPDLTFSGSGDDAFVAKIKADGTGLVYCGYIGGYGDDMAYGIAVDSNGNAYLCGHTGSTQTTFPVRVGPDLTYNGAGYDAFVAKIRIPYVPLDLLLLE